MVNDEGTRRRTARAWTSGSTSRVCKTARRRRRRAAAAIDVNGQTAKANRLLRRGDQLVIGRPYGRKQRLIVKQITDRHLAKAEARELYQDLTPPPTPEEIELRRAERAYRAAVTPPRAPDKRQRRALRRMKEGE